MPCPFGAGEEGAEGMLFRRMIGQILFCPQAGIHQQIRLQAIPGVLGQGALCGRADYPSAGFVREEYQEELYL